MTATTDRACHDPAWHPRNNNDRLARAARTAGERHARRLLASGGPGAPAGPDQLVREAYDLYRRLLAAMEVIA